MVADGAAIGSVASAHGNPLIPKGMKRLCRVIERRTNADPQDLFTGRFDDRNDDFVGGNMGQRRNRDSDLGGTGGDVHWGSN